VCASFLSLPFLGILVKLAYNNILLGVLLNAK
jgi:hypothetical protein